MHLCQLLKNVRQTGQYTLSEHFIWYLLEVQRFDMLCVPRRSFAYHCCNVWLVALLSPSPVWLLLTRHFAHRNAAHWMFFFFFPHHSLQTQETVVHENHRRSVVSEILNLPCLAPTFSQTYKYYISSPLWHLVWTTAEPLDYIYMLLWI